MSFREFVTSKKKPLITVSLAGYQEQLTADAASLLLRPEGKLQEARKQILNLREISQILAEIRYPLANEMVMALRTADAKKVSHAHLVFNKWLEFTQVDRKLTDQMQTAIFNFKSHLYGREFAPTDVDEIVKSSLSESTVVFQKLQQAVEFAVDKIPGWKWPVHLEAIYPENSWVIQEAHVQIGEKSAFNIAWTPFGVKITSQISSLKEHELLANKLAQQTKRDKVQTLYLMRPKSDRRYFEMLKRDLALGIQAVLPNYCVLKTKADMDYTQDVWKIRIDERYLKQESEDSYQIINEEAPIRWLERKE